MKWTIGATIALLLLVLGLAWAPPALEGFHLGYNSATDERCETRLGLQWCDHRSASEVAGQAAAQAEREARERGEAERAEATRRQADEARERADAEQFDRERRENIAKSERENREVEARRPREERESKGEG